MEVRPRIAFNFNWRNDAENVIKNRAYQYLTPTKRYYNSAETGRARSGFHTRKDTRMSNSKGPQWLDSGAIEIAMSREKSPERSVLEDILAKSFSLETLSLDEIVALLRVREKADKDLIISAANKVKQKVYGDRIVITAPLHADNHCASGCLYCAYRSGNAEIKRKRLDKRELREAGKKLMLQGHKRLILTSGQTTDEDIEYFVEAINVLSRLFDSTGEIRRINIDLGVLTPAAYVALKGADAGTVNIYQETYQREYYEKAHPSGPKSDYLARLMAPQAALESGIEDVGLGLALGLGPRDYDLLGLSQHIAFLSREYGVGARTVNLHRVRPAPGCDYVAPFAMNDEDFLMSVAILRLAVPYTGILLTTREPAGIWRQGCDAGCSQLLTGSVANPYESWANAPNEQAPFPIGEETHLDEVVRFLLEEARHLPSFCTACPRLGRNGKEFINMVSQGDIKSQCGPNSLASFMEFLMNYATPYTRKLGEKLIDEKLAQMDEHERGASERLLQKVRSGRMDEFI